MVVRASHRMKIARWFATGFGVGYLPRAPGTAGSLLGVLLFLPMRLMPHPYAIPFLALLFIFGVYMTNLSLPLFTRKDPREIVIDEIWAMLLVLFMIPPSLIAWTLGFILFRFFDIKKPSPIREAERLPNGWGVMADDLVAAAYTIALVKMAYALMT